MMHSLAIHSHTYSADNDSQIRAPCWSMVVSPLSYQQTMMMTKEGLNSELNLLIIVGYNALLQEVVKQLLSTEQKDVKFVFNPFSCVQCKTDFTPVWKRDKPGSKNVICEKCITSNQKRLLKSEHTAKLKTVFAKALQKEQEIGECVTE